MRIECGWDAVMGDKSFGKLLGALIKQKRMAQGLTQLQLSEDAYGTGNRVRRISELETGSVANPHPKTVDPIISVLAITEEEIEECAKAAGGQIEDDLSRAYLEASNLIEALLYRFDHNNPEASLLEVDEFLKAKATEWRQLQKKIQQFEASDERVETLKRDAMAALNDGDFLSATKFLSEAEEFQLEKEVLKNVSKLVELRVLKAQVDLFAGDKDQAVKKFIEAASSYAPFDKEAEVCLLDSLAFSVYEQSRRSTLNHFDVADRLLKAALEISQKQNNEERIARFKSKIAMMHRSQSEREPPHVAIQLLEKAVIYCRESVQLRSMIVDLNAWASTKIILGNCLMEASKICDKSERLVFAEESLASFREVLDTPNKGGELDELLCHASNGLGSGLMQLMNIDGVDRIEVALEAYYQGIEYSKLCHDSDMWAAAHINIGNLLTSKADSVESETESQYLRLRGMGAFLSALEVYPSSFFPYPFAHAHYSLGMLYFRYGVSIRNELTESYLVKALVSFEAAEFVFTEELRPKKWADMEYFKGLVFSLHAELDGVDTTKHDYEMAKQHLEEAIRVYSGLNLESDLKRSDGLFSEVSDRLKAFLKYEKETS